jgi:hypothetical protein
MNNVPSIDTIEDGAFDDLVGRIVSLCKHMPADAGRTP